MLLLAPYYVYCAFSVIIDRKPDPALDQMAKQSSQEKAYTKSPQTRRRAAPGMQLAT